MYQVPDPNEIEPGTVLMIPKVPDDLVNPNNPQSVELARQLKEKYLKMSRTHSVSQSQSAAQTAQPTAKYTEFIGEEIVKRGMNLAQLSRKYYNGETAFWIYIYEANMHQISNPNDIELGTVIRIPKLAPELIDPNNPKCVEDAIKLKKQLVK